MLTKRTLTKRIWAAGLAAAALSALPAAANAAWTRSWAIEWFEPAHYDGGAKAILEPGTDCPTGPNPEIDWVKELIAAGYTSEQANWLRNPANPTRSAVNGQNQMAFRGKDRANVYVNPTAIAESGQYKIVTGTVSEGLNLDGDATNGFKGPTGEPGIDNNFYKATGCWKTYRGAPRQSSGAQTFNTTMRDGGYTVIIVAAGSGSDPMNDPNVTVGIYNSPDKLVKDGNGGIAHDYTYRIRPDAKLEALFKARSNNGVISSTEATDEVWMRDPGYARELQLLKARISFTMKPDGTLKGNIGGYRPWEPVYRGWVNARGPVIESLTWVRLPDVYYALKRHADYSPTGPDGEKTHISFALRIEAVPAFVVTPDAASQVASIDSYKAQAPRPTPVAARPAGAGGVIDGIVVPRGGRAVSQTPEQMKPPAELATASR